MDAVIQKDFADWLSPMIVKELRQGLRSRAFVYAFLLVQGMMIFCMFVSIASMEQDFPQAFSGVIFWGTCALLFLVLMPGRGLTVISGEVQGKTMELLFFTGLTARWIVIGKWLAIMVQSLLLASTILPYMILRYYLGGVELSAELPALVMMLLFSAMLTAVAMAISSFRSWIIRIVGLCVSFLFLMLIGGPIAGNLSLASMILMLVLVGPVFLTVVFSVVILRVGAPSGGGYHD